MKLFILKSDTAIPPFLEDSGQTPILDKSLTVHNQQLARSLGLEIQSGREIPRGALLLLFDYLFLSEGLAKDFLDAARKEAGSAMLGLDRDLLPDALLPISGMLEDGGNIYFDAFFLDGKDPPPRGSSKEIREALVQKCRKTLVPGNAEIALERLPNKGGRRHYQRVVHTLYLAAHIRHWLHILALNRAAVSLRLAEHVAEHGPIAPVKVGGRFVSRNALMGKNVNLHRSVFVEDSIIGEDVEIDSNAIVRSSYIGNTCFVGDHATIIGSAVGPRCFAMSDMIMVNCTSYSDSTLANIMLRHSLVGRNVFLTSGVILLDAEFNQPIKVDHNGKRVETGLTFLGSCVGHEALLGTRAIFLPGRAIPNRTIVVMRPEEGAMKIPADLKRGDKVLTAQGTLMPYDEAIPGYQPPEYE